MTLDWWYWVLLESFGGAAVAAGVLLWRGDPRGWHLSRLMQALQVVQFQTTSFGLAMAAGFQVRLLISGTNVSAGPAFYGTFSITGGTDLPWWVSINFFAIYALYALSRPAVDAETSASAGIDEAPAGDEAPVGDAGDRAHPPQPPHRHGFNP
jgi:hypothetical protein